MTGKDLTTLFTGKNTTILAEVDSTNSYLNRVLRAGKLPEGTVVRASRQNAGRGQASTSWESEDGKNLLASFVFYPSFIAPKEVFLLNKTFTLGVFDFISALTGEKIRIKWPNDIYWNNLKTAGILIENSIGNSGIHHTVLGIGINVNQKKFSPSLPNPVSLSFITGNEIGLDDAFNSLCSYLEARYLQLKNGDTRSILDDYDKVLFGRNEWRSFVTSKDSFEGKILSVDENGRLMIEDSRGDIRLFNTKEVSFVYQD